MYPLHANRIRTCKLANPIGGTFGEALRTNNDGSARGHWGWDLDAEVGAKAYAIADGSIADSGWSDDFGNFVTLRFTFGSETLFAFYAHLSKISVTTGEIVEEGRVLGLTGVSGKTAVAAAPHLHFEIREKAQLGKGKSGRRNPGEVLGFETHACDDAGNVTIQSVPPSGKNQSTSFRVGPIKQGR